MNKKEEENLLSQFVFVSPKDQESLNEIKTFLHSLKTFKTRQFNIKKENQHQVDSNINFLKMKAKMVKNKIDKIVNDIENHVCL